MNNEKPLCFMCGSKTGKRAKSLALKGERIYVHATKDPIFCSINCAANRALIDANEQERHWCPSQNEWGYEYKDRCVMCRNKTEVLNEL